MIRITKHQADFFSHMSPVILESRFVGKSRIDNQAQLDVVLVELHACFNLEQDNDYVQLRQLFTNMHGFQYYKQFALKNTSFAQWEVSLAIVVSINKELTDCANLHDLTIDPQLWDMKKWLTRIQQIKNPNHFPSIRQIAREIGVLRTMDQSYMVIVALSVSMLMSGLLREPIEEEPIGPSALGWVVQLAALSLSPIIACYNLVQIVIARSSIDLEIDKRKGNGTLITPDADVLKMQAAYIERFYPPAPAVAPLELALPEIEEALPPEAPTPGGQPQQAVAAATGRRRRRGRH